MFGVGFGEFLVIAVVLVLVVGPESMPRLMKALARGVREFRRATRELRQQVGIDELLADEDLQELRSLRRDPLGLREVEREVRQDAHAWMSRLSGPEPGQPVPPEGEDDGESGEEPGEPAGGEASAARDPAQERPWPAPRPAAEAVPRDPRAWAPKVVREAQASAGGPGPLPFDPDPELPEEEPRPEEPGERLAASGEREEPR